MSLLKRKPALKTVRVRYFAHLKDVRGTARETVSFQGEGLPALYRHLVERESFDWPQEMLRVSLNGQLADWDAPLGDNDDVVLIPPLA